MTENITITIAQGNIKAQTEKAILVDIGNGEVWLPKSKITIQLPDNCYTPTGSITLPKWLAKKLG